MEAELKKRAQKIAEFRNLKSRPTETQIREVAEVYKLITGKTFHCNSCNFYGFISEINKLLITEPIILSTMAEHKGKFRHDAASRIIIRHTKNGTKVINEENLNEGDNYEFAAKNYPHLLEQPRVSKASAEEESLTPKQKLQAEYKELYEQDVDDAITAAELKQMIAQKQNPENKI